MSGSRPRDEAPQSSSDPASVDSPMGRAGDATGDTLLDRGELGSAATMAIPAVTEPPADSLPQVSLEPADGPGVGARYVDRKLLGEGGMGEVRLVRDALIGRDVARKTLKGRPDAAALDRFLREARVQAQLEHPAVVPVYDLVQAAGESPSFTMKRVRGRSLESILAGLAGGDAATIAAFPRRRLLNAFVQVCLAVEYAHTRGVLHRDLKPANLMLGDFGEIHVLDWGLARVRGMSETDSTVVGPAGVVEVPSLIEAGQTVEGSLMGTPGYMAPEQARGKLQASDARADVYSLGAILFEILFLEPLHGQKSVMARLSQTVLGPSPAMAARARVETVPPELRALVERAIAIDPAERVPSARALADSVERFLDGERDAARRAELAEGHVGAARALLRSGAAGAPSEALRELGRALALDPTHAEALRALESVLTTLPQKAPPEAETELRAMRSAQSSAAVRTTAVRVFTWLLAVPVVIAFGVLDWTRGGLVLGTLIAALVLSTLAWRAGKTDDAWMLALGVASFVALSTFSFLLGPFLVVPGLASTNAMFFAMTSSRPLRPTWLALGVCAIAVPFALELAGLDPHYFVGAAGLEIRSTMTHLPLTGTLLFLLVTSIATIVTPTVLAGRMRDRLAEAEEKVFLQAWHLRHLLPRGARV